MSIVEKDDNTRLPAGRLLHLDILRGFALLGIILVNMQSFAEPILAVVFNTALPESLIDRCAQLLLQVLVAGKFYILFSIMFGASFALIMQKASAAEFKDSWRFPRRLSALLVIGLFHGLFIWSGDILHTYAMMGSFLWLFFRKTPTARQLKWGIYFILQTVAIAWLFFLFDWLGPQGEADSLLKISNANSILMEFQQQADLARNYYDEASFVDLIGQRWQELTTVFFLVFIGLPTILGYFLIGAWLFRSGRLVQPWKHHKFYKALMQWGLLIGLPLSAVSAYLKIDSNPFLQSLRNTIAFTLAELAHPLLALAILSFVVLYGSRIRALRLLAPAGRMALTNYLMQSLFWTTVMYGYGLGFGKYINSQFMLTVLGLLFYCLQVMTSHWWLARYNYGPMEWLWRRLSYSSMSKDSLPFFKKTSSQT